MGVGTETGTMMGAGTRTGLEASERTNDRNMGTGGGGGDRGGNEREQ